MQPPNNSETAGDTETDIEALKAEIAALRMAVAFLVSEVDLIGSGQTSTSVIEGLMGQHAHAVGNNARICFAIEDICEMIATLRDA